ncbi:hypothetical protein LTR62_002337 [Meristemomyces frigidus]|uniref:Allantoate permease n=1 Tax=Meristemomyces frigidus TaxID=1508187 RepID=A0AAN7T8N2_9PEZI|nr:hypothetical protein LTR62_002337 [Meristemomyces frigidus]
MDGQQLHATTAPSLDVIDKNNLDYIDQNSDKALEFLRAEEVGNENQLVEEKKLLRKIDFMIMPLMWCCYMLEFLDKSLLNYASVMGILKDTNINSNQYANISLLFYVAFLVFELPHAYLMQRFPAAKYLGGIGIWYTGVGCATIFGSLISYGFQHYHASVFKSWQIMFLVVGLFTICIGILVVLVLPDNPMTSRLSHAEKVMAIERIRENNTGIENKHFKLHQALECLRDPQVILLCLITITASIPNGAVGSFQSILIKSFGFTNEQTTLLQIPSGVIALSSVLIATWMAGRFNARTYNIMLWSAIGGLLGGSLLAFLPKGARAGKLGGNYLTQVVGAFLPCAYSLAGANFAGHTKKVTMNALLLMSFCVGNIIGPLTFRQKDAPSYTPAKITIVAVDSTAIVLTATLLLYYKWENKRRDRNPPAHRPNIEFLDLTDRENKELRYKY